MSPSIPQTFLRKKAKILSSLSVPETDYSDKSPKGSVDEPIRELITLINAQPGWCTTSSCSGRVAVFVEGPRCKDTVSGATTKDGAKTVKTGPGGKGGGRWLFVSHEPIATDDRHQFGLGGEASPTINAFGTSTSQRLINLAFSPLILHVLCATLRHAKPLLTAAINAGFRESGVQSLRALDDPDAGVMLAIRTAGVGFTSTVGFVDKQGDVVRIVSDEYLEMCVRVVNDRFAANMDRRGRLEDELKKVMAAEFTPNGQGESKEERRQWKKEEGLRRQQAERQAAAKDEEEEGDSDSSSDMLGGV